MHGSRVRALVPSPPAPVCVCVCSASPSRSDVNACHYSRTHSSVLRSASRLPTEPCEPATRPFFLSLCFCVFMFGCSSVHRLHLRLTQTNPITNVHIMLCYAFQERKHAAHGASRAVDAYAPHRRVFVLFGWLR